MHLNFIIPLLNVTHVQKKLSNINHVKVILAIKINAKIVQNYLWIIASSNDMKSLLANVTNVRKKLSNIKHVKVILVR